MNRSPSAVLLLVLLSTGAPGHAANPPLAVLHYQADEHLIRLPVRVKGSRPLSFILDSGALHTIVDSAAAVSLHLPTLAADSTRGAGRGAVPRRHTAAADFQIGTVRLHVADPWVIDLSRAGVRGVDGLIGAELFERYVVRIDPESQTLTIIEPAGFRGEGSGTPVPLVVKDDRLYVDMTLTLSNGISETHRMRVDTGSSDAASDDLVRRSPERRKAVQGVGLGQSFVDESGVFESVRIGPYTIRHAWGASNDHPAVGMEILRRFTTTFDAPRGRLYLVPNVHLKDPVPAPPPTPPAH